MNKNTRNTSGDFIETILFLLLALLAGHTGSSGRVNISYRLGVLVLVIDAILKPILIGKSGGSILFLVLFLGVIGGISAWGFTGMFKGAIILSVFYTIFVAWLEKKKIEPDEEIVVT